MNSELWSVQECKLHKISINTKGHNSETKKWKTTIIVRNTSSWLDTHSYSFMKISQTITKLWGVQEFFWEK